jgi:hypothetical protein
MRKLAVKPMDNPKTFRNVKNGLLLMFRNAILK